MLLFWASQQQSAPAPPPAPLAVSDFKNGVYSIGGVNKTLAQMWESNADWGAFDPANVVAGTGLTIHSNAAGYTFQFPASTPLLAAALAPLDNLTAVVEFNLASANIAIGKPLVELSVVDLPAYNVEQDWNAGTATAAATNTSLMLDDNTGITVGEIIPLGANKAAMLFGQPSLAVSNNGNPAIVTAPVPPLAAPTVVGLFVSTNSNGVVFATATIEKITFYHGQPPAALAALSV